MRPTRLSSLAHLDNQAVAVLQAVLVVVYGTLQQFLGQIARTFGSQELDEKLRVQATLLNRHADELCELPSHLTSETWQEGRQKAADHVCAEEDSESGELCCTYIS